MQSASTGLAQCLSYATPSLLVGFGISQNLVDLNVDAEFSGSVADCLQAAFNNSDPGDRILVFGSFYTVAAGLQALAVTTA